MRCPSPSALFLTSWLAATAAAAGELVLIAPYASWSYLDDGSDAGTAWRVPAFDDSSWGRGEAQLGYGDGDEITLVRCRVGWPAATPCPGGGTADRIITTYFRRRFEVEDPVRLDTLTLRLVADDAAVVYLNGVEVVRQNLPVGDILYDTLASGAGGEDNTFTDHALVPGDLVAGTNVLAVEIHQHSPASSDISFNVELLAVDPLLPELLRGPYLQLGTPTGGIVRWRTSAPVPSRLERGASPGSVDAVINDPVATTEHEVQVSGLLPETRYFYAVGTDEARLAGFDEERSFVTGPPVGERRPFRVWAIGDSGTANADAAAVRDAYRRHARGHAADLWLMLGDNAYTTGTDAQYTAAVFDMYPTLLERAWLWPTLGNHDALSVVDQSGPYFDQFTLPEAGEAGGLPSGIESYYSFDYSNVHFVCLDSERLSGLDPASAMLAWLAADLAATNQEWIVAFWHHPPYTKGSHDSDNPADSGGRMTLMRERVLPILESADVDLVLTGHSHAYERSVLLNGHYGTSDTLSSSMVVDGGDGRPEGDGAYVKDDAGIGAVYAVNGSSGKVSGGTLDHPVTAVSLASLGSMVLDFDGLRLDAVFVSAAGTVDDSFTLQKDVIFTDGFESGDVSAWSSSVSP